MNSAMHFPFTEPKSEIFLKNALFFWDSVDFVVPWSGFRPNGADNASAEALELIARNYVPTDDDKKHIHDELMDFCTSAVPATLQFQLDRPDIYDFYPQKLLPETWRMLVESKLARVIGEGNAIETAFTSALSLLKMRVTSSRWRSR